MKLKKRIADYLTANLPPTILDSYLDFKKIFKRDPYKGITVNQTSSFDNIYHCCIQKSASQWIKGILADPIIFKNTGLKIHNLPREVQQKLLTLTKDNYFELSLPERKIISPIYCYYENFQLMKKPENYRAFYVIRDPRDLLISQYYSMKNIHKRSAYFDNVRPILNKLGKEEGIIFTIKKLVENRYWERLRDWGNKGDINTIIIKYENLIGKSFPKGLRKILNHLKIELPEQEFNTLIRNHSFSKLTGRKEGTESSASHLRKGISGDWKNHFTKEINDEFYLATQDLVDYLGYN